MALADVFQSGVWPVKKPLTIGAVSMLLSAPALAQKPTIEQVMQELNALSARVGRLEQDNAQLKTENAALQAENDRLGATSEYLKDNAAATRKQLAQEAPKVAEAERISKGAEWASRISWKADMRYRHENVDPEAVDDLTRHRIRARLAMTAKINDTLTGTIGIATSGGLNDPRSTNQTLGEGWTRKGIALDLAHVDWKPIDSFGMSFGKQPQPWYKVSGYFFDNDINPEGISARYATGPFFANAYGMWLSERGTDSDSTLLGGQLGLTGQLGGMKLSGAVGYFDVGTVQGEITTNNDTLGCVANTAFFLAPNGNTTFTDGVGCSRLLNDFNMVEALAQAEFNIADQPLQLWAQFIQNTEADDLDTGWLAGFNWGKASNPMSWEFGYAYGAIEKDAQFGQFVDSDFGGGVTDVDGSIFKLGFAPARNWVLNGTYFMNNRFIDAPGATERDYDRYQIDFNWKF
jgi:Putative porin